MPEGDVGAVLGDLQSRRAVIRDTTTLGEMTAIHCDCALDRLLGYITDLRGMTRGRGQFTMRFDRNSPLPVGEGLGVRVLTGFYLTASCPMMTCGRPSKSTSVPKLNFPRDVSWVWTKSGGGPTL